MAGDVVRAQETVAVITQMCAGTGTAPGAGLEALRIGHTAVMRAYAAQDMPHKALEAAEAAARVGVEVLEAGWCAALDSWAQVGDVDKVLSVMRAMEARGLMLNRIHWTIAIKAACRSGDAGGCAQALKLLQEHVREPDVVCFNTIIFAALNMRDIDSLVVALREMVLPLSVCLSLSLSLSLSLCPSVSIDLSVGLGWEDPSCCDGLTRMHART